MILNPSAIFLEKHDEVTHIIQIESNTAAANKQTNGMNACNRKSTVQ